LQNAGKFAEVMKTPFFLRAIALAFAAFPLDSQSSVLDAGFDPGAGPDGAVYALAEDAGGRLLVGGGFTNFAGTSRAALVRLLPDGRVDDSFAPQIRLTAPGGAGVSITAIWSLPQGGTLIGGTFTEVDGQPIHMLARLLPDGRLDETFAGSEQVVPGAAAVRQIAVLPNGSILIAGDFHEVGTQPRPGLARLHPNGALDAAFLPAMYGQARAIHPLPDGRVQVLASPNGNPDAIVNRSLGLIRLNPDGSRDNSFVTMGTQTHIGYALAVRADGTSIVCGDFKQDTQWVTAWDFFGNRLVEFPAGTGRDACRAEWCPYPLASAVIGTPDGGAWVGGPFADYVGRPWNGLARIDREGVPVPGFDPGSGIGGERSMVHTLLRSRSGALYAGGEFSSFDGANRKNLLRLSAPAPAAPRVIGQSGDIVILAGQVARFWVEVAEASSLELQWEYEGNLIPGATAAQFWLTNTALTQAGQYVCRVRNGLGEAATAPMLLRVKPRQPGQVDPDFNARASLRQGLLTGTAANPTIHELLPMPGGQLIVAGDFVRFNGEARTNLVKLNRDGSLDPFFRPVFTTTNPIAPPGGTRLVHAVALSTNRLIYAAGRFDHVNGEDIAGLARLDHDGKVDPSFQPRFNPDLWRADASVQLMVDPQDRLIMAGETYSVDTPQTTRLGIVRLLPSGEVDPSFSDRASWYGLSERIFADAALLPDGVIVLAGDFSCIPAPQAGEQVVSLSRLVRMFPDGRVDTAFRPLIDGPVHTVVLHPSGDLLIGGSFNMIGTRYSPMLGRVLPTGNPLPNFNVAGLRPLSAGGGSVDFLEMEPDGRALIAGEFLDSSRRYPNPGTAFGVHRPARIQQPWGMDSEFDAGSGFWYESGSPEGLPATVSAMTRTAEGDLVVAGTFDSVDDWPRDHLVRFSAGNGTPDRPDFIFKSQEQVVPSGLTTEARAHAYGFPRPKQRWFVDGIELPAEERSALRLSRAYTLRDGPMPIETIAENSEAPASFFQTEVYWLGEGASRIQILGDRVILAIRSIRLWNFLEFKNKLEDPEWHQLPVGDYRNPGNMDPVIFVDCPPSGTAQRLYRVRSR